MGDRPFDCAKPCCVLIEFESCVYAASTPSNHFPAKLRLGQLLVGHFSARKGLSALLGAVIACVTGPSYFTRLVLRKEYCCKRDYLPRVLAAHSHVALTSSSISRRTSSPSIAMKPRSISSCTRKVSWSEDAAATTYNWRQH